MAVQAKSKKIRSFRKKLERLLKQLEGSSIPVFFTQAIRSFLVAMDYNDSVVMRSSLETAKESFFEVIIEAVEKRIKASQIALAECAKAVEVIDGVPIGIDGSLDELGYAIRNCHKGALKLLTDLSDGPVAACQQHNLPIPNAGQLRNEIKRWRDFEESVLKSWPWSTRQRKPVNKAMIEESKRAFERREGESIEDLVKRLGGDQDQVVQ